MTRHEALAYVRNTGGHGTVEKFYEDWWPVGIKEWSLLVLAGLVEVSPDNKIFLTEKGRSRLAELEAK